jgi:hypothetical protein
LLTFPSKKKLTLFSLNNHKIGLATVALTLYSDFQRLQKYQAHTDNYVPSVNLGSKPKCKQEQCHTICSNVNFYDRAEICIRNYFSHRRYLKRKAFCVTNWSARLACKTPSPFAPRCEGALEGGRGFASLRTNL